MVSCWGRCLWSELSFSLSHGVFSGLNLRSGGAIVETGIILPIGKVASLRKENISLETLPELIAFADSIDDDESKKMVFLLVARLIERL